MLAPDGTQRAVQMWDLGADGASLTSPRPITQGAIIELRFELPATGGTASVVAKAKAVYSSYMAPAQFRIGVVFVDLDPASAAAIDAFLR